MTTAMLQENPDRVIAKAWADEDFKRALLADPRAALASQGIEIPEGITLNVLENSDTVINFVLPKAPDMALFEESLDGVVDAARCGCGGGCHGCGGGCHGCGGGCHGCGGCGCGGGGCNCIACTCLCV